MKHPLFIVPAALLASFSAYAGAVPIPEPDILPLLGVGIAVAVAVKLFRKKK